ncbi:MAG: histidine--tRNA ligase [Patescibacteria group bacterium]
MINKPEKSKNMLQTPKGLHDILPDEFSYYRHIYDKAQEIASYYEFLPIQTPILEKTDLFTVSLGEANDIVEKQMYILRTRGGDYLALRPEGTAPIVRSYLEHGMHTWPQPVMLFYKGSFFRHEKPQRGRFREFEQFGIEIINEEKPVAEAVIIKVLTLILEELGIGPIIVHINTLGDKECRSAYRKELVSFYRKKLHHLCKDCRNRFSNNPLRLLDCKEPKCIEIKQEAPQMLDYLCESCKQHFKEVIEFLEANKITYFLDTHLVRGLDYYTRTVFEIFEEKNETKEEMPLALASGGRYDYLAKTLSEKNFPATGGALGVDRIVESMKEKKIEIKLPKIPKVFFIQLGNAAKYKSLNVIEMFRKAHIPLAQSVSKDSLKSQLKIAAKLNIPLAIIMGQKESLENSLILKDMETGTQDTVGLDKIIEIIRKKI